MGATTLSKKQQKAQSFRAKQKAKRDAIPDLPEADDPNEEGEDAPDAESSSAAAAKAKSKPTPAKKSEEEDEAYAPLPEKAKKRKREAPEAGAEHADVEGYGRVEKHRRVTEPKPKKEVAQRFILFLGNIGFKTTREQVAEHFKASIGRIPSVRLLTEKGTGKSRGIAFLELSSSTELQSCLKLHHSILNGKRMNVELTAGGGGKSEGRREKLKQRNERVSTQREKREKETKEKEDKERAAKAKRDGVELPKEPEGIAAELSQEGKHIGQGSKGGDAGWGAPIGDGYKMRGGRRVKVKTGGPGGGDRRPPRPKWTPTGANAVTIS